MSRSNWMNRFLPTAVVLGLLGCTSEKDEYRNLTDTTELQHMEDEHAHHHEGGPHGGHILELGTYHGEITMGENRQITVYILGADAATAALVTGAQLVLALEGAEPITLESAPQEGEKDGASSRFVTPTGSVPESVKDIEAVHGSLKFTLEGKDIEAAIAHEHDHGHAH